MEVSTLNLKNIDANKSNFENLYNSYKAMSITMEKMLSSAPAGNNESANKKWEEVKTEITEQLKQVQNNLKNLDYIRQTFDSLHYSSESLLQLIKDNKFSPELLKTELENLNNTYKNTDSYFKSIASVSENALKDCENKFQSLIQDIGIVEVNQTQKELEELNQQLKEIKEEKEIKFVELNTKAYEAELLEAEIINLNLEGLNNSIKSKREEIEGFETKRGENFQNYLKGKSLLIQKMRSQFETNRKNEIAESEKNGFYDKESIDQFNNETVSKMIEHENSINSAVTKLERPYSYEKEIGNLENDIKSFKTELKESEKKKLSISEKLKNVNLEKHKFKLLYDLSLNKERELNKKKEDIFKVLNSVGHNSPLTAYMHLKSVLEFNGRIQSSVCSLGSVDNFRIIIQSMIDQGFKDIFNMVNNESSTFTENINVYNELYDRLKNYTKEFYNKETSISKIVLKKLVKCNLTERDELFKKYFVTESNEKFTDEEIEDLMVTLFEMYEEIKKKWQSRMKIENITFVLANIQNCFQMK